MIVENFFTKEELEPCKMAIEKFVDQLAQKLHGAGKIKGSMALVYICTVNLSNINR